MTTPDQREPLLAPELISLTVVIGEAQHIELSLPIDLKLGESNRQGAEIFSDCCKITERHELDRENIAIPRLKLQVGAGRLNLHDQRIATYRQHRFAEARIDKIPGKRCERRDSLGLTGLANSLATISNLVFAVFSAFAT